MPSLRMRRGAQGEKPEARGVLLAFGRGMPKQLYATGRAAVCALVAVVCAALSSTPAHALHKESPPVYRITSGASNFVPPTRSWGNYMAFTSSEDLTGTGNARPEVFIFNMAFFDCFNGTTFPTTPCENPLPPFLQQVTNGPGDPQNASIALPFDTSNPPDGINDSQWLAFDALGNFNGGTGPSAGHRQIFLKNLITKEIRQVTFGIDGDSIKPSLSSLGGLVVFESTAQLTTNPTPVGVSQIYAYETKSRILRQITHGVVPSTGAIPNDGGGLVTFQSAANLLGDGSDTGISQIFWFSYDKATHTSLMHQLTHGNGPSQHPFISIVSSYIVFDSSATDLPGTLGGGGTNIYKSTQLEAPNPQPPAIIQLTSSDHFGNCSNPSVDPVQQDHIGMICTGDPFWNGTTGNRLFVLEVSSQTLFQITGAGDVLAPIGQNIGNWFLVFASSSDLTNQGSCGYQIYVVDYLPGKWDAATQRGQLPPDALAPNGSSIIGVRTFEVLPGDATMGSQIVMTTQGGATTAGFPAGGSMRLVIGAPDEFTGQASLKVSADHSTLPPVPVPGYGTACLSISADGEGTIDCDGVNTGGDVDVSQDHITDDSNPLCLAPDCREDDASCQGNLPGPHRSLCPVCIGYDPEHFGDGTCAGGPYNGQPCTTDSACQGSMNCVNGTVATCNGSIISEFTGTYAAGGMVLNLPVNLSISSNPGADGTFCTADDTYTQVKDEPAVLRVTTGAEPAMITDADDVAGATLTVSETGMAFDCNRLRAGDLTGARLVGVLPFLDIPNIPSLHDLLVSVRLEAAPPHGGTCSADPPCLSNADCDDGNPCNGVETCVNNSCVAGTPIVCNDGNPCNGTETCNPADGSCLPGTPCNDNNPCNGVETCDQTNGCQPGTPIVCTDNNACNGVETCNPADGTCLPGMAPNCDDNNPCTTDSCDQTIGCVHTNVAGPCDDGSLCTTNDMCSGGVCVGTPVVCDDNNACNGVATCNPADGSCQPGTPPNCNDNNPCTDDSCDPSSGCVNVDNDANACSDNNLCTTGDHCAAGSCVGTPVLCNDGNDCNGVETCNPADGTCQNGMPMTCNDNNPCTDDSCLPVVGCVFAPNTNPCDDGSLCTTGDTCAAGQCVGVPVPCDDGNLCNGLETCNPLTGTCQAGVPLVCNDANPCTLDTCDPLKGCVYTLVPNGVLCLLDALAAEVAGANPNDLGGALRQARLEQRLARVRSRLVAGLNSSKPRRAHKSYLKAMKNLRAFETSVRAGIHRANFDLSLGNQLITDSANLLTAVQDLMTP